MHGKVINDSRLATRVRGLLHRVLISCLSLRNHELRDLLNSVSQTYPVQALRGEVISPECLYKSALSEDACLRRSMVIWMLISRERVTNVEFRVVLWSLGVWCEGFRDVFVRATEECPRFVVGVEKLLRLMKVPFKT